MPSNLIGIPRQHFVPGAEKNRAAKLPAIIKTVRFNIKEDGIILKNWKDLLKGTRYSSQEEEVKAILFDNTDKADDIKANKKVIGC